MKKWILRTVLGVVALVIIVAVVVGLVIDSIAKAGIERGGSYALRVDTQVKSVDLRLLTGRLTIDGLQVANPEGFTSEHLMQSGTFDVQVRPGSLLSETIKVSRFELDGLQLDIEQKLQGSNISVILANLRRFESPDEPTGQRQEPAEGKKVHIGTILIKDVTARFHLLQSSVPISVRIPELKLENVTSEESGVAVAKLVSRLVPAILAAVVEQSGGVVPAEFLNDMSAQVADAAKALGDQATELVSQASGSLKEAAAEAEKAAESVKKSLEDVTGTLGGLLGEKKDSQKESSE